MPSPSAAPRAGTGKTAETYSLLRADAPTVNVLFVSPSRADHATLSSIFSHSNWRLHEAHDFEEALHCIRVHAPPVVICDTDASGDCWRGLLEAVHDLDLRPEPRLVVSSRTADDCLWSEVLNLGGYNVLERPFEKGEVVWVVSHAWLDWRSEFERTSYAATGHGAKKPGHGA